MKIKPLPRITKLKHPRIRRVLKLRDGADSGKERGVRTKVVTHKGKTPQGFRRLDRDEKLHRTDLLPFEFGDEWRWTTTAMRGCKVGDCPLEYGYYIRRLT